MMLDEVVIRLEEVLVEQAVMRMRLTKLEEADRTRTARQLRRARMVKEIRRARELIGGGYQAAEHLCALLHGRGSADGELGAIVATLRDNPESPQSARRLWDAMRN